MAKHESEKPLRPPQHQWQQPGIESEMSPRPVVENSSVKSSSLLHGNVAIISGGDSGIGRAVAVAMAKAGANIVELYLNEHGDAKETKWLVEQQGRECLSLAGDIGDEAFCQSAVERAVKHFGRLDIVVNNAAEQHPRDDITEISAEQLDRTFRTNIYSYFYLSKSAVPRLRPGSSIVNTTSVTAYRGSPKLLDYSATKGAIVAFTRSLALSLVKRGIRVNGVAPGPIWTPLIPSTFPPEKVATFGSDVPMQRAGEPAEVAACYVFLASSMSSYMTGQVLHPNGGEVING